MIEIDRTTGADPRSLALRTAMDDETFAMYSAEFAAMPADVRERVGAALSTEQADLIEVAIAVDDGVDVGHAALRALADGGLEVKKVYVPPAARGRGLSRILMQAVEDIAREKGETVIRLQTGTKQAEAIALYGAIGYHRIEPFGPYAGLDGMVCFEKAL